MDPSIECASEKYIPEFQIQSLLGKGAFGTVWKAVWNRSKIRICAAIKRVRMEEREDYHECNLIESFDHPNIIKLHHKFYSFNALGIGHLNLVFEYIGGWDLQTVISHSNGGMSLATAVPIFKQLLQAVSYCHRRYVAHRDLKPANVMVEQHTGAVKLIDFGHAKVMNQREGGDDNWNTCYCVSRYYRAPELLLGNIHYGVKVDVWSLGCIFVEMLLGTPLFPGEDEEDQMLRIISILGSPSLDDISAMAPHIRHPERLLPPKPLQTIPWDAIFSNISPTFTEFLSGMLNFDPDKRWSVSRLLRHPIMFSED